MTYSGARCRRDELAWGTRPQGPAAHEGPPCLRGEVAIVDATSSAWSRSRQDLLRVVAGRDRPSDAVSSLSMTLIPTPISRILASDSAMTHALPYAGDETPGARVASTTSQSASTWASRSHVLPWADSLRVLLIRHGGVVWRNAGRRARSADRRPRRPCAGLQEGLAPGAGRPGRIGCAPRPIAAIFVLRAGAAAVQLAAAAGLFPRLDPVAVPDCCPRSTSALGRGGTDASWSASRAGEWKKSPFGTLARRAL